MTAAVWVCFVIIVSVVSQVSCLPASPTDAEQFGTIHFAVISGRNVSGKWNTVVHLQLDAGHSTDGGPWEVHVKQSALNTQRRASIDVTATTGPPAPPRPSQGYELIPEVGYYKLHTKRKVWHEARKICHDEAAHLAIVNSDKEIKALHGLLNRNPGFTNIPGNNVIYLGFHDFFKKGQWLTLSGDTLEEAGFDKFHPGEPHGAPTEDCGCFVRNQNLHDCLCTDVLGFICEQELF